MNIVNAQQGNAAPTQKLLLSNQLVKVRTVPRQPHQMQISFAQQPGVSTGLGANTGISVVKTPTMVTEQHDKPTLGNVSQKPTVVATPIKVSDFSNLNLHFEKLILMNVRNIRKHYECSCIKNLLWKVPEQTMLQKNLP